jgi:hypothetical protein
VARTHGAEPQTRRQPQPRDKLSFSTGGATGTGEQKAAGSQESFGFAVIKSCGLTPVIKLFGRHNDFVSYDALLLAPCQDVHKTMYLDI